MNGVRFNTGATSTGLIQFDGGVLRFENGASLRNAGNMEIRGGSALQLNTSAMIENSGILTIYDNPAFGGDDTGKWVIPAAGRTIFHSLSTVPYELDLHGALEVIAGDGRMVTFNKGGTFHHGAKIYPQLAASFSFRGARDWKVRGRLELIGTGFVTFWDTTLTLQDVDPNTPDDDPWIASGARFGFVGTNTVSGPGSISTTGFYFGPSNVTVDGTNLHTFGISEMSIWDNPNGSLTLQNGAKFLNDARFVIQTQVGSFSGNTTTLFHNMPNGRVVHDSNTITNFDVPFHNEGFLEFIKGNINFLKTYRGTGGVAVSGGAVVDLGTTPFTDPNNLPRGLQASGAGSSLKLTLSAGQVHNVSNPDAIKAQAGGKVEHRGGDSLTISGPAATAIAQGAGSVIEKKGGDMIGNDGSTMIGLDGSSLIGNDGSSMIGLDGSSMIGLDGSSLVAAGAGNLVAAGGGNRGSNSDAQARLNPRAPRPSLDELTGIPGLDAVMAKVDSLSTDPNAGRIFVDTGGNARVTTGSIIAEAGGIIAGAGTFTGPGLIKNGGTLLPGSTVGTLTWTGNLTVQSGGLLGIEIAGPTAGTQHDRVNVSGSFNMSGAIGVRFLNGFGNVQPTDFFDIATAGSPISTTLAGTRVSVFGTNGSLEIQLVNGGNTLRLTNYQTSGPITFNSWANSYGLTGAAAAMTADPNNNGLSNLLEYALGLDPTAVGGSLGTSVGTVIENGQEYLSLSYTKPTGNEVRTDITYTPQRATMLRPNAWSAADIIPVGSVPGPGSLETVTVRSIHPLITTPKEFLRLQVTLTAP